MDSSGTPKRVLGGRRRRTARRPRRPIAGRIVALLSVMLVITAALIATTASERAEAALSSSQQWVTAVGPVTGGIGVGSSRTYTFGASGLVATQTKTAQVATGNGVCHMNATTPSIGALQNAAQFLSPTPPASTPASYELCPAGGGMSATYAVTFNRPVMSPMIHITNIDASSVTISGTSTTGAPLTIERVSGNIPFDVVGNTVNPTLDRPVNNGCQALDGSNPTGGCGSLRITASSGAVQAFTLLNSTLNTTLPLPQSGDSWQWTMSFPTATLTKQFTPGSVLVGQSSTLTFTLTNPANEAQPVLPEQTFTDALPAGLRVASSTVTSAGCGAPTVTDGAGGALAGGATQVRASGVTLTPGQVCTISVFVTADATGSYTNTTANLSTGFINLVPNANTTLSVRAALRCTADVVYGLNSSGEILAINRTTGTSVQEGYFPAGAGLVLNALGMSAEGRYAFAVAQSGTKTVYRYDTATGTAAPAGTIPEAATGSLFMGAVNPVDGRYYVGGASGAQYVFYAFDTATDTSVGERFRLPAAAPGFVYSDFTFDSHGRAFVVSSSGNGTATANQLLAIESVPTDGSVAATRLLAYPAPTTAAFQGMAFGGDGYLYAQYATATNRVLARIDPNSGAVVSSASILNPNSTTNTLVNDLASCSPPHTLTARKFIDGRHTPTDQFTVSITGNGVALGNTGTTSGAGTGLQDAPAASAGPVVGVPGRTYTITETPSGGAVLGNYRTLWECVDTRDSSVVASGTGNVGTVTMPSGSASGSHVVCVFTNVPIPTWTLAKQAYLGAAALPAGAIVQPGDEITYRVTAVNTSGVEVTGASLTDDLSHVLDDAAFVAGSAQLVIGAGAPLAVPDPIGAQLAAGPFTLPASTTAHLTYRVVVSADAWSRSLTNTVTGTGGKPGQPTPPLPCPTACSTTQVTPTPVQLQKVGEASTGEVVPMDGSEWAIWDAPTAGAALVDPVPTVTSGGVPVIGLFRDATLTAGTYWLEETRALDGFALLAQRIPFVIAADGSVTLGAETPSNVELVDVDGIRTIRVEDVPALELPDAGGPGTTWIYVVGLTLLVSGSAAGAIDVARRRRRAIRADDTRV